MKKYFLKIFSVSFLIVILAMLLEAVILQQVSKNNSFRMTGVLLNQVNDIIKTNERTSRDLYESVKEDCKVRAQSVSYILDSNPSAENNLSELKKISDLLSIDEINIFDETGKIISGSIPDYYGLTFDSGDQVSFFKPMLQNKKLTMCQDFSPNTFDNKSMMYAITWNKSGTKMIQIGIEPFRLIEVMKRNELSSVVKEIPLDSGTKIFVASASTGEIIGVSPDDFESSAITNIAAFEFPENVQPSAVVRKSSVKINGERYYSSYVRTDEYIICVATVARINFTSFNAMMLMMLIYLLISVSLISLLWLSRFKATDEKNRQLKILTSMSGIYYCMYLVDLRDFSVVEYSTKDVITKIGNKYDRADEMMRAVMLKRVCEEHMDRILAFTDIKTLASRMTGKKIATEDFLDVDNVWYRAGFVTIEADENKVPQRIIFTVQDIEEEKNKEANLIQKSTTDELTECLNRRAYQDDVQKLKVTDEFILISFDINGLKNVNDTIGHNAGDEIIKAAACCMKSAFGKYGSVYRTGGDEFIAIIKADEKTFFAQMKLFEDKVNSWSGDFVKALSVSTGYVFSSERNWKEIHDIERTADQRMYEKKAAYYKKSGVDRRDNQKAYFAASSLYLKILKINLTKDTFKIVNDIRKSELTETKGYGNTISSWLTHFALTGQVHEDDVKNYLKKTDLEYLRKYFKEGKQEFSIIYRRNVDEEYRKVLMEIIPADDYSDENQNCYLYVKKIEL